MCVCIYNIFAGVVSFSLSLSFIPFLFFSTLNSNDFLVTGIVGEESEELFWL